MNISLSSEVQRKLIHLSSLWIPLAYFYTDQYTISCILLALTIVSFIVDIQRHRWHFLEKWFNYFFIKILRTHELKAQNTKLTGATYLLLSSLITVIVFDKAVAVFSLLVLILADTSAAIVGKYWGKGKTGEKTMIGTFAFVLTSVLIALIWQWGSDNNRLFFLAIPSIIAATLAEFYHKELQIDDNFSIPLASGFALSIMLYLFN